MLFSTYNKTGKCECCLKRFRAKNLQQWNYNMNWVHAFFMCFSCYYECEICFNLDIINGNYVYLHNINESINRAAWICDYRNGWNYDTEKEFSECERLK